jgi:hypothetical protein
MLYPVVAHPGFLDRNNVSPAQVARARFLSSPLDDRWRAVFVEDRHGTLHFRPSFPHAAALRSVLDEIGAAPDESEVVEDIYEELFGHDSFTGRSGAMYGYEGIGSIYWHMVAKLLLTVQENHAAASDRHEPADVVEGLAAAYRRIRDGLGFRKSPEVYGAFPIDCYSHTPTGAGAKQPGMTGQVKEEILARFGETGLRIRAGTLRLEAALVDPAELFGADLAGTVSLSLGQTPIGIAVGDAATVRTTWEDGRVELADGNELAAAVAAEIFARSGAVERVDFTIGREHVPPRPH